MKTRIHRNGHVAGFSLIEILIAVVVLATGLLALTALQGRLAQASADAKVRSRVASLLTSRMDELRASQYASIPPVMPTAPTNGQALVTPAASTCAGGAVWVCTAQNESGISGLSVGHAYERYMDVGGSFQSSGVQPLNLSTGEFKRIILTARWNDAAGAPRNLSASTDVSPLSLTASRIPNAPGGAGSGGNAIVRQDNPAGPGVIPIAIGGGDATAASNPRPEIISKNNNSSVVGTRFDVLTYEGLTGAAVIQRRVETAAISCSCTYGAGGNNLGEIYRTSQWPAEWTGERYEVTVPSGSPAAPGQALSSGPKSGADQSPLCTECCRDHHDAAGNATKFDPERTASYVKYNASLTAVGTSSGTDYINACRLVRVDGFWRTATDLYAKHFGLINTTAVLGVAAKSAAPDATAVTSYQAYVKSYLAGYTGGAASIANATDGGQVSGAININAPAPKDERFLHARGLYVDYLTQKARDRITKARLTANCASGDLTECSLPYLPFTTINNTELSYWEARTTNTSTADTTILAVATGSSLVFDPLQPTRGRTNAKSSAANGSLSDAAAIITRSNAGVAIGEAVDPADDAAEGVDKQAFRVTASGTGTTGQNFTVKVIGLPQTADTNTSNDPAIAWTNATGNANCNATVKLNNPNKDLDPNDYACNTYGLLGIATTVRLASYFREYTVPQTMTATCGTQPVTATADRPTFSDYAVSSAVVGATAATSLTVTNNAKSTEFTEAVFATMPSGSRVDATFTLAATLQATIASCVATRQNANAAWQFSNIVWTRSWTP